MYIVCKSVVAKGKKPTTITGVLYMSDNRGQRRGDCLAILFAKVTVRRVLTRVCLLVVEVLDKAVVSSRERTTKERTNPVNPVVAGELCASNSRTKAAGRVERTAGIIDTYRSLVFIHRSVIVCGVMVTYHPS
jgi:hypothetical protein